MNIFILKTVINNTLAHILMFHLAIVQIYKNKYEWVVKC